MNGEMVNIYDTDQTRYLDSDIDTYELNEDIKKMDSLIQDKKVPKEERINKLLKDIYEEQTYLQQWYREPDHIYD